MEEITRGQNDQQVSGLSEAEAARDQKQCKEPTARSGDEPGTPAMQETDSDPLDLYHFEITGKISTRCDFCRKRTSITEQEFCCQLILQRILLGEQRTCAFCFTGNVRVYGVTAVLKTLDGVCQSESATVTLAQESLKPAQRKGKRARRTTSKCEREHDGA